MVLPFIYQVKLYRTVVIVKIFRVENSNVNHLVFV